MSIVGGGQVYTQALHLADATELTTVPQVAVGGDTYFPEIDTGTWRVDSCQREAGLTFQRWVRRSVAG